MDTNGIFDFKVEHVTEVPQMNALEKEAALSDLVTLVTQKMTLEDSKPSLAAPKIIFSLNDFSIILKDNKKIKIGGMLPLCYNSF